MSDVIDFVEYKQSLLTGLSTPYEIARKLLPHMPHGIDHVTVERSVRQHQAKLDNGDEDSWMDFAECYVGAPCFVNIETDLVELVSTMSVPVMVPMMVSGFTGITIPIAVQNLRILEDLENCESTTGNFVDEDNTVIELFHVDTVRVKNADAALMRELQTGCLTPDQEDVCESFGVECTSSLAMHQPAYSVEITEMIRRNLE